MWLTALTWKKKWFAFGFVTGKPIYFVLFTLKLEIAISFALLYFINFLRRRQKEKRINPPNTSSGGPSSPASPPSMASPGGFFGGHPGSATTPPTSLTPFSGSPGTEGPGQLKHL